MAKIQVYDAKTKKVVTLRKEHVCTRGKGGCLRMNGRFAYCARYSLYAGARG